MRRFLSLCRSKINIIFDFFYDCKNYLTHSFYSNKKNTSDFEHSEGIIIRLYHSIEKGLAIKELKYEFGLKNVIWLQSVLIDAKKKEFSSKHIESAIKTLEIYYAVHDKNTSDEFQKSKKEFFERIYSEVSTNGGAKPLDVSMDVMNVGYKDFFRTRQSVREFEPEELNEELVKEVISISKHCPSACNRQAIKIYYSLDMEKNSEILSLQNGSRSFRDRVPGLLIVCADIRYQEGPEERNLGYIEGGIWIMSLVNALRYMKLGSCVLNWCVRTKQDKLLKRLLCIPQYYNVCAMIAFGYPKMSQRVPYSIRKDDNHFIEKIK